MGSLVFFLYFPYALGKTFSLKFLAVFLLLVWVRTVFCPLSFSLPQCFELRSWILCGEMIICVVLCVSFFFWMSDDGPAAILIDGWDTGISVWGSIIL